MPKAVARPHPAGGRALPWALLLPDEALSGVLLPSDKMPFGTHTPPDEGLSGSGERVVLMSRTVFPNALPGQALGQIPGQPPDGQLRMVFPHTSSGRGGARLALACGGQPMSFSSCRSEASGKSVRKWSRMRTNDSAGVQSAISGP